MDYLQINQQAWDQRTPIHRDSEFYDVKGFLNGKTSLQSIELTELDVKNKSLLHLQCHFGLDSLSFARLGANVTGVDLSPVAIEQAQSLATQTGLKADFICSDVYQSRDRVAQEFDIVFTSYGALCWLPDLDKWAAVVAASLKPGGQFYMVEFHPIQAVFEGYRYFAHTQPDIEDEMTYTENSTNEKHTTMTWSHPISDVINALLKAGLTLEYFNEFDFSPFNCFEGLIEAEPKKFTWQHKGRSIPLAYSISATK